MLQCFILQNSEEINTKGVKLRSLPKWAIYQSCFPHMENQALISRVPYQNEFFFLFQPIFHKVAKRAQNMFP